MKRCSLAVLLVIAVTAAVAGWALARRNVYARHEADEESARLEAHEKAKNPARYFASVTRTADRAVIVYRTPEGEREIHIDDPAWLLRLSVIIGGASYEETAHGFWISTPEIRLYRKNEAVLSMMNLHATLRCYGSQNGGDFIVGPATIQAITALVQDKTSR